MKLPTSAWHLALALSLAWAAPALAGPRAQVEAELAIASPYFTGDLGAAKADVESKVGVWLAAQLEQTLAYLDWVGKAEGAARGAVSRPAYALIARFGDQATGCGTRFNIDFAARTPAGESPFPPDWRIKVGDECDLPIQSSDAAGLIDLLQAKLAERLAEQRFRDAVEDLLTKGVPLAKELKLGDGAIGVPFRPVDLKAAIDTRFLIEFGNGGAGGGDVEMELRRAAPWGSICQIASSNYAPLSALMPQLPIGWHPKFAEIFDPSRLRDVKVTMRRYRQTLNPSGPSADAPVSEP
jgi:hypothetical protein